MRTVRIVAVFMMGLLLLTPAACGGGGGGGAAGQYPRTVLMRFSDVEEAMRWYRSPQYQELAKVRRRASDSNIVLVKGYK